MINFKQKELSKMLFEKLQKKFPEIELVEIMESPENPNHIWVNIIMPEDEDREIALAEKAGKI
jgi:phosphoenolpyruvate synthase/pyruvate phosphate dikinase